MDTLSVTLCELFAQAVKRCPENLAIDHEQGCLTYRQLCDSSTSLARTLIGLGASKASPVVLVTGHGSFNIIAILAILKTGSCFVPIDRASWPTERINQVFDTVQNVSLVINTTLEPFTPPYESCRVLDITSIPQAGLSGNKSTALASHIDPEDTACIIFTSGSTGRPKGVVLSHKSLCLYSQTRPLNMNIGPGDRLIHVLSVAFDACACILFSTLCNGGTIVPAEPADLHRIAPSCNVMAATPSLLSNLPIPTPDEKMFSNMHTVILGGETASPDLLGSWIDVGIQLYAAYGLSETTSMGTIHKVERAPQTAVINPFILGPFMEESPMYLLDQNSTQIVDDNIDGEIVIGGGGVAKGYYKDELKTRESFIDWKGLRVYKTGDYGRWICGPSGNRVMEFIGRRDRFVKNDGFTVNLDRDVQEQLYLAGRTLGVKSVHAVSTKSGIVAVVTPSCVDTAILRERAKKTMCAYCVPRRIEATEEIPLSANGKVQPRTVIDALDIIDRDKDCHASKVKSALEKYPETLTRALTDESKLTSVLWAATQVFGCLDGRPREITGEDSFIGMGGTSLLAIRFISELRRLKLHLSMRDLFVSKPFSEVAGRASTTMPLDPTARWIAEDPSTARTLAGLRTKARVDLGYDPMRVDIGPLTSLQLELAIPTLANATMNINQAKMSYDYKHITTAERAWSAVWRHEPVFRTEISLAIGSGAHIVHREATRKPTIQDYENFDEYGAAVQDVNMAVGLGCRLDFIRYHPKISVNGNGMRDATVSDQSELTVVLTIHHSLMDGSSLGILLENVERASKGRALEGSTSSVDANLSIIATQRMHDQLARSFFASYLRDVPVENRATESRRMATRSKQARGAHRSTVAWFVPTVSIEAVTDFARSISVSGACVYYCAWAMAISAFEGNDSVVVGSVFSNRTAHTGYEKTIGPYMATLPLVFNFEAGETVRDRLQRTMDDLIRLREFAWARSDQVGIGHRLGNLLALQLPLPDKESSPPPFRAETSENSDFPLCMLVEANGDLRMLYDDRQYNEAVIQRIGEHFKYALCSILNETYIGDCMKINRLHERLLANADFSTNSFREETVKTALERSADRFEDHVALEDCSGKILTYRDLDKLSNNIAHHIVGNVSDTKVVAVFGDGTINWVISIIGILKTGRTYVPLDPKWSTERGLTVCFESSATALLFPNKTQETEAYTTAGLDVFLTDSILACDSLTTNFERLPDTTTPDDDLVAVYTSGSTGTPKGIPLTNRGILALLRSCPEVTMFAAPGRKIAQFMSPAFDYCNIEILGTLLHGATLVLRDPSDPFAHLRKVDTATITPSVLTVLNPDDYPNLQIVYSIGEPITSVLVCKFGTKTLLYNVYGPAECSVVTSCTRVIPGDPITVGVAVPTARMYILDEDQQHVSQGVKGEIYVAGPQVMRGYLQAERMSIHAVLDDPWHAGQRMYRTGDFGARGHDKRVTYLGRIDRQVKLRGFRVELDGVEQAVMSIGEEEGMRQCSAVALNGTLVAFVTCIPGKPLLESEEWIARLQDRLKKKLFSASVPQAMIQLEQFPMNFNGKVDAKALESMYANRALKHESNVALETTDVVEAKVADEWRQILQLGPDAHLRCTDNFFTLGGHSVLVLLLANRLSTAFQVELALRELLPVPTFRGQVDLIKYLMQDKPAEHGYTEHLESNNRVGLPVEVLTELEKQVWHQCQAAATATAFNIAKVLTVSGPADVEILVASLNRALASDPVFRTNIVDGPQGPQRLLSKSAPTVRLVSHLDVDAELNWTFDLERDQLIRIFLTSNNQQTNGSEPKSLSNIQVVIVTSHVIVDLGSLQNLLHLTSQAYAGATLPIYNIPRHLESDRWTRVPSTNERNWWREYLKGYDYHANKAPLLSNLFSPPGSGYFNGNSRFRHYSGKLVTDLKVRTRETGTTQHHVALTAAALLLQWLSGENDIVLGAPDSGRRSILDREVCGQFLDRLPIRVRLPQGAMESQLTTDSLLVGLRESSHKALANAIPFSRILESLGFPAGSITKSVISDIRLCECMVTFHTRGAGLDNWLKLDGCTVAESSLFAPGSKFPLMLEWFETDTDQWSVHIEHDTNRILAAGIDAIENTLEVILDAIARNSTLEKLQKRLKARDSPLKK